MNLNFAGSALPAGYSFLWPQSNPQRGSLREGDSCFETLRWKCNQLELRGPTEETMEQFSAPGEMLTQHSLWEPRRNLNKTANVSQLAISLQPTSFEFILLYSMIFNFLERCFSDHFSIFKNYVSDNL